MIRYMDPGFFDYLNRLRAKREAEDQAFRARRKAAIIAQEAANAQGVGE